MSKGHMIGPPLRKKLNIYPPWYYPHVLHL
jgi:hypothetical protein